VPRFPTIPRIALFCRIVGIVGIVGRNPWIDFVDAARLSPRPLSAFAHALANEFMLDQESKRLVQVGNLLETALCSLPSILLAEYQVIARSNPFEQPFHQVLSGFNLRISSHLGISSLSMWN